MGRGWLGIGEGIAGVSAILLFAFMYLDWFGVESSDESIGIFSVGHSAWDALDFIPIVLVFAVAVTLVVVVLRLSDTVYEPPVPADAVVAILGAVSALLILFRILDPPNFGSMGTTFGPVIFEGTVQTPIYLALAAALGIAGGGCLAMRGRSGSSSLPAEVGREARG